MSTPPAGWYSDPELVNTRRYWDGAKWTEHRQELPVATAAAPITDNSGSSSWRWVGGIVVAIILAVVTLRILFGSGLLDGSTTVDPDELATSITADLLAQDVAIDDLECDDPGSVTQGDVTYCRGTADKEIEISIKVTFQSDGGYAWETM